MWEKVTKTLSNFREGFNAYAQSANQLIRTVESPADLLDLFKSNVRAYLPFIVTARDFMFKKTLEMAPEVSKEFVKNNPNLVVALELVIPAAVAVVCFKYGCSKGPKAHTTKNTMAHDAAKVGRDRSNSSVVSTPGAENPAANSTSETGLRSRPGQH